jgi:hypothetical protein
VNRQTSVATALVIAALSAGLGGCASRAAPRDLQEELADLRREERALREEIAALRTDISRLTEQLAAKRTAETAPRRSRPNAPPAPAAASPGPAIVTVLEAYRQALEDEDLQRLRQEIYRGALPADDLRYLELWFDRTDELQVELEPRVIDVEDGRARAIVRQTVTYRLSRTRELRRTRLDMRMLFEREGGGGGWRLVRVDALR